VTNAETEITAELVLELLRDQHPDLADRPLSLGAPQRKRPHQLRDLVIASGTRSFTSHGEAFRGLHRPGAGR
jgi:hypothetical protein